MTHLIGKFLPYLLLLYFLFRAVKKPIYLLGIPFLIFFQYCIFFDGVKIFNFPGSFGRDVVFLMWVAIIWFAYSSRPLLQPGYLRQKFYVHNGINLIDAVVVGLLILSCLGLFVVYQEYTQLKDVLKEFFTLTALFLGFFLLKSIICYTDPVSLKDFLFSIVLVNTLASVLYILDQGLHVTLYQVADEEYQQEIFQGQVITRVFWFMPVLWFFSISYLIVFRQGRLALSLALIGINLIAIFVSYTRSFVAIAIVLVFLYNILISLKRRSFSSLLKTSLAIIFAGTILILGVLRFSPDKFEYFEERVISLKKDPSDEDANTMLIRFERTGEIFHKLADDKKITGYGPVTEIQFHGTEDIGDTTADMVWTGVVFRWGYIGLVLFILLYLISAIKAFNLFMRNSGVLSLFGLLFLLVIVSQIMESFTSWTFMNPGHFALGLWYFGILSALTGFGSGYTLQIEKTSHD